MLIAFPVDEIFAARHNTYMDRVRLKPESIDAYKFKKFDPDNCHAEFETTFVYDLDGDGIKDEFVIKEKSWFEMPRARDMQSTQNFIRYSCVKVISCLSSEKNWRGKQTHTAEYVFRDSFQMSMDYFNNNPSGACPIPSFAGLYAVLDSTQSYLELSVRHYTLIQQRQNSLVTLVRDI